MKEGATTDERIDRLVKVIKDLSERLSVIESQLGALVRQAMMREPAGSVVDDLFRRRFAYTSQHEEDGMLYALFQHIGATTQYFVDIGCGGNGGNSGFLARECGWSGLMVDAVERNVGKTSDLVDRTRVKCVTATVSSRNVGALLEKYSVPVEPDLVSIDIDSTDYWVLDALTQHYRPRAIISEYNSLFGPTAAVTVPDAENFVRQDAGPAHFYYGASLTALTKLAESRGYRLVLTDLSGTNALFVRRDLAPDIPGSEVPSAFRYYREWIRVNKLGDLFAHFRQAGLPLVET